MKLQRQLSMGKLWSAVREKDLLVSGPRKKPKLGSVIVAKCRELWEGLTVVVAHRPVDDVDYFRGSYEFSCTTTPVNALAVHGRRRRRQRRLPPCVGAKQVTEMLAGSVVVTRRDGRWSPEEKEPERSPQAMPALDIDGLAEEFIERFREQLRMQVEVEQQEARPKSHFACSVQRCN